MKVFPLSAIRFLLLTLPAAPALSQSADTPIDRSLQEIVVSGTAPEREGTDIRRRYPETFLNSQAASAYELLQTLPGIRSNMEGTLTYRGSEKVLVLIDGRPAALLGDYRSEVLIQLPASAVARIETDGNPDASRTGEGDAGIINIVLKKPVRKAREGSASLSIGNRERYGADARYGLHSDALTLSARAAYRRELRERSFRNRTVGNPGDPTAESLQEQDNTARAYPQTFSGGVDLAFEFDRHHSAGAGASLFLLDFDRLGKIQNRVTAAGTVPATTRLLRDNAQRQTGADGTFFYQYRFNDKGEALRTEFAYRHARYDEKNHYIVRLEPEKPNKSRDKLAVLQRNDEYDADLVYICPLSGGQRIETGYNYRFLQADNRTDKRKPDADGVWRPIAAGSYRMELRRSIHALYAQYGYREDRWETRIGVRGEGTVRRIVGSGDGAIRKNYFSVLPQATFSYRFSPEHRLHFNYGRRINRPGTAELNPFTDNTDPLLVKTGNPGLKAEQSDNLSLGHTFERKSVSAAATLFWRMKSDAIGLLLQENDTYRYANYGNRTSAGAELSLHWGPVRWAELEAGGTVCYDEIDARGAWAGNPRKGDWNYLTSGSVRFRLPWRMELQADCIWNSRVLTPQGTVDGFYRINAGIRQQLLQDRLALTLSADDLADSAAEVTRIRTARLEKRIVKSRDPRRVWIGASYQF